MSAPVSQHVGNYVPLGLHIAFAVFLLLMSFVAHGRVPGLDADASAALGFLPFFGFGKPVLVIAIGTCLVSVLARECWLVGVLAVTAILAVINVWTGIIASLSYLSFTV